MDLVVILQAMRLAGGSVVNRDQLKIECQELLQMAEENPQEIEVIIEMLIEADEELCESLAA